jgi:alpha-L-rhamnosidase
MKRITIFLLALIFLVACSDRLNITIINPNVEQQFHEQALATAQPRFSWNYETTENEVVQQNYRIIVATTAENAQKGIGDLWDSGVIPSSQMLYVFFPRIP